MKIKTYCTACRKAVQDKAVGRFYVAIAQPDSGVRARGQSNRGELAAPLFGFRKSRYPASFALASRFKLTPCSAACMASERWTSGGIGLQD
jgi:hypothetical protein